MRMRYSAAIRTLQLVPPLPRRRKYGDHRRKIEKETPSTIDQAVRLKGSISDADLLGAAARESANQVPNTVEIPFKFPFEQLIATAHVFGTIVIQAGEELPVAIFHEQVGKMNQAPQKSRFSNWVCPPILKLDRPLITFSTRAKSLRPMTPRNVIT